PDLDLSLSGFGDDEIKKLLRSMDARDKRERVENFDLDAALEKARAAPRAKPGDVFALGDQRVLCGDATDPAVVAKLFAGKKAAMAFAAPPYNVGLGDHGGQQNNQRRRRIQNDSLPPEEWERFCRGWARTLLTNIDGACYVCMSTQEWPVVTRVLAD